MTSTKVPFNLPYLSGDEMANMQQAVHENVHISGDGKFTKACQQLLEGHLPGADVLLTTSCTHALEMAALLLEIQPGDEVILPSFTFVSTANAFVLRGAKPVFVDIRPDTLNLDEQQVANLITPRTRAIIPVHYAGVACEMNTLCELAKAHNLAVIEDNAHGLFGYYDNQPLGTFGRFATQSFHETKNFHCGEGGALVINRDEDSAKAEILREKGTNRSQFFRGEVDKYTWVDVGSSYVMSDLLAAFLYAQLQSAEDIQSRRKRIWTTYHSELADWAAQNDVQMPTVPAACTPSYHLYYLVLPTEGAQQEFMSALKQKNISTVFHYLPLHLSRMGREFGGQPGDCPVTERVAYTLVRLPMYNGMTENEQAYTIDTIKQIEVRTG